MSLTRLKYELAKLGVSVPQLKKAAPKTAVVTVANISTANATDLTTAQALANQTKTTVNALLTELRSKGLIG